MTDEPVYAGDDDAAPDSAFAPGRLEHLVAGNRGRLLDARRTPVSIAGADPGRGAFVVRIEAFEDAGAHWELGLEEVGRFQFELGAATAGAERLAELERSRERFDRELVVDCDPRARDETLGRVRERRDHVDRALREHGDATGVDLAERIALRDGHPPAQGLLDELMAAHGLAELEDAFTATFVTNPRSGEVVKGHAIVLAELGLAPYRGRAPRDPGLFAGAWARERRAEHLLWRLAFTQALFAALGLDTVTLYRAAATDGALLPSLTASLVSATFSRQVAEAHFEGGPTTREAVLWRHAVPVDRLLMTFIETRAMNERFREAEAVLLSPLPQPRAAS